MPLEVVYHGSHTVFDKVDLSVSARSDANANGNIGFWTATDFEIASRFGAFVLMVSLDVSNRATYNMPVAALGKMAREYTAPSDYVRFRERLLAQGKRVIFLTEMDGTVGNKIVLDVSIIKSQQWYIPVDAAIVMMKQGAA